MIEKGDIIACCRDKPHISRPDGPFPGPWRSAILGRYGCKTERVRSVEQSSITKISSQSLTWESTEATAEATYASPLKTGMMTVVCRLDCIVSNRKSTFL